MINVRKVKAAGLCDCCDKKKVAYEVYCRISLGSFFIAVVVETRIPLL